jgi:hypothetical protein
VLVYNYFLKLLQLEQINLETDSIKAMLRDNTQALDATKRYRSELSGEVSGGGYPVGGVLVTGKSVEVDDDENLTRFLYDSIRYINISGHLAYCDFYIDTGSAATDVLLFTLELPPCNPPSYTASTDNINVNCPDGGILIFEQGAGGGSGADEKVKINVGDTLSGYLDEKLSNSGNVTFSEVTELGIIKLKADVDLSGYATGIQLQAVEDSIPVNVSELTNDAGYLTSYTETDPVFSASEAALFVAGDKLKLDEALLDGDSISNLDNDSRYLSSFEKVLDRLTDPPLSPNIGDRYLVIAPATGDFTGLESQIVEWDGATWQTELANPAKIVWVQSENIFYKYETDWEAFTTAQDLTGYLQSGDNISELTNDAGYITGYTETDPIFSASQAFNIDATAITNLSNLSGINTGDQDLSSYATTASLSAYAKLDGTNQPFTGALGIDYSGSKINLTSSSISHDTNYHSINLSTARIIGGTYGYSFDFDLHKFYDPDESLEANLSGRKLHDGLGTANFAWGNVPQSLTEFQVYYGQPKLSLVNTSGSNASAYLQKYTTLDEFKLISQNRVFLSGTGLSMNGSGYANRSAVSIGTVWSLDFWYKTSSTASQIVASGNNSASIMFWFSASNQITVRTNTGAFATWTVTYADNAWHHWAMTRNGNSVTLYKDGVSQGTQVTGAGASQTFTNIGNYGVDNAHKCVGILDQLVLWNKTLTGGEVATQYNSGLGRTLTSYTNVIAEYRLDSNYNDSGTNAYNLTARGSGNSFTTGQVPSATQALSDISLAKIINNGTNLSYGTFTLGHYSGSYGTSNVYEGLTHQWDTLGTSRLTLNSTALTNTLPYYAPNGSAAAPAIAPASAPGSGFYFTANNDVLITTAGVARLQVFNNGNFSFVSNGGNVSFQSIGVGIGGLSSGYSGQFNVQNSGSTSKATAVIKAVASQTGNLTEWQNSAGTVKFAVTAAGTLTGTGDNSVAVGSFNNPNSGTAITTGYPAFEVVNTDIATAGNYANIFFSDAVSGPAAGIMGVKITDHTNNYGLFEFWVRAATGTGVQANLGSTGLSVGNTTTAARTRLDVVETTNGSPAGTFSVSATGTAITNITGFNIANTSATTNNYSGFLFSDAVGVNSSGAIGLQHTDRTNHYGDVVVATRGADGYLERLRVSSNSIRIKANAAINGELFTLAGDNGYMAMERNVATSGGAGTLAYKSRGTPTSKAIVAADDAIMGFQAYGYDGANYITAGRIAIEIDGTPGTNDMPGRVVIYTTADGASTYTEAVRFTSAQKAIFAGTIRMKSYTVATLPVGAQYDTAMVSDALAPVFGALAVGGGAVTVPVYYDGSNWMVG